jgi:predicted nuclease of restriction endonuclease-like (RecB) superfamily/transposase-like protein
MDQRLQFLSSYQKEEMSVADLCRAYGISRPTAYRWINRYNETGPEGLVDRSRRPHSCSHATLEPMENAILVLRAKHPSWGARKLKARLETPQPDLVWPAASTFGNILSRAGLTSPQRKRKRTTPCILGQTKRSEEREFYLRQAIAEHWSKRELERQMKAALFERSILTPAKVSPPVRQIDAEAASIFKDAYMLEFLDLPTGHDEADLHSGLLFKLKDFLIELGRDFCLLVPNIRCRWVAETLLWISCSSIGDSIVWWRSNSRSGDSNPSTSGN